MCIRDRDQLETQYPQLDKNGDDYNALFAVTSASWHYNAPLDLKLDTAPDYLEAVLSDKVKTIIRRHEDKNHGIKLLTHPWQADSLVVGGKRAKSRVLKAQLEAYRKLELGIDPNVVIRTFVEKSELDMLYAESIGMKI